MKQLSDDHYEVEENDFHALFEDVTLPDSPSAKSTRDDTTDPWRCEDSTKECIISWNENGTVKNIIYVTRGYEAGVSEGCQNEARTCKEDM